MAQFAFDIVVENPHADVFGENAQLRSDMAVADDTQYLAPGFEGTLADFRQTPSWASEDRSGTRRNRRSASPKTSSATERVLE